MNRILFYCMIMLPVSLSAQFDGVVGSEGCKAIHCDDVRFIGWATGCSLRRGYENIALPANGYASYGDESAATGKVNDGTTTDCVSLGDGGEAILTFEVPIANGQGYDFAVFENALDDRFLELAFVEASSDGVHYFRFPAVSNTQTEQQIGSYGTVEASLIYNLAGKYRVGWGVGFDLDELPEDQNLDKNNILYVKITDVVGSINPLFASYDSGGKIINDPYPTAFPSGGFDLSGVGVIHNRNTVSVIATVEYPVLLFPNPCRDDLFIKADACQITLYNVFGQRLYRQQEGENFLRIDMSRYAKGIYFVELKNNQSSKVVKVVKQ